MRRIDVILLCAFVLLFVDNNGVTRVGGRKDYVRSLAMLRELKNLRHGILPGTRWCGRGNIARDDTELGAYEELDGCCRAHDHCEDYIRPRSKKYGLYNRYVCRSSLCECEVRFYDCLARISGLYASIVGRVYFKKCTQCLRTYYDAEACEREGLYVIEENDRYGHRVFCARLDRNLKWSRHGRNVTAPSSTSAPQLFITDDDESGRDAPSLASSRSSSDNDDKYLHGMYESLERAERLT